MSEVNPELIQEKIQNLADSFKNFREGEFKELKNDVKDIKSQNISPREFSQLQSRVSHIEDKFLTKEDFEIFKKDDWGLWKSGMIKGVGIILTLILVAVLALVVVGGK